MINFLSKIRYVLNFPSHLREEAVKTCIENEIPLTEENILNVIEMIKFKKERTNLT